MIDSLFTVKGSGPFPFVMLQRGKCHPNSEKDVDNLFNYSGTRTIKLRGQLPNDNLWKAHGWSVISRPAIYKDDYNIYHTWPC
jgi:hypothetical protein